MAYHIVQIGLGIVGSAYALAFKSKNMKVTGIEYNKKIIEKYKNEFKIYHITDNLDNIRDVDFILLSICTPLNKETNELDMSYLLNSIDNVEVILKNNPDAWVVIRSTVVPFFTKKYQNILEEKLGFKIKIAFVPEFLRAKTAVEDAINPWQVIIGLNKEDQYTNNKLTDLYSHFINKKKISFVSIEEAELLKIFHNSFNACKISFFNQAYLLTEQINKKHDSNINMQKIADNMVYTCEGLINKKYGTKVNQYYGNACLPKDSQGLATLEEEYNMESKLFKSVVDTNNVIKKMNQNKNIGETLDGPNQISFTDMFKLGNL